MYSPKFTQDLLASNLAKVGANYRSVAIIGGQSTGKSTLLNLVFGTEFKVMDKSKGHSQTTKGIWCSTSRKGDVLIFDIEGTDSKERGD